MSTPSPLLAGLHLGLLQAGYLLALSRALSSAHTTYALVLAAWLAGAAAGLWWTLPPRHALALGLLAYLGAQWVLGSVDFLAVSPWWFAPAIAASGLWSGRFFAAAISGAARPGRVFAGETDGFLIGTVGAVLGYAYLGRHALWAMPLGTGLVLLRGRAAPLRVPGVMVTVMVMVMAGCDDPRGEVPAPDPVMFREAVYPTLLRDCSFAGCHADPRRPLYAPGPGRVRLDPATDVFDPPTAAEISVSYDRARALLLREGDEPPPLLHKPTAGAAHRGRDAAGDNVYDDPTAPGLWILTQWAARDEDVR